MQYRPPNANQEVSNSNYVGSCSDILGRIAASLSLVRFGHPIALLRSADKRIANIVRVRVRVKQVY